jgi:hypothetical protein
MIVHSVQSVSQLESLFCSNVLRDGHTRKHQGLLLAASVQAPNMISKEYIN